MFIPWDPTGFRKSRKSPWNPGLPWMDIFMLIPILAICWWKKVPRGTWKSVFLTPELRLPLYTFGCGLVAVGNEGLYYGSPSKNVIILVVTVTGGGRLNVYMF